MSTSFLDLNNVSGATSPNASYALQRIAAAKAPGTTHEKARQVSEDFESVYLNTMLNQMFTAMDGDGPFGGGKAVGIWRSFLTDEYAKSFAKAGGIGIASEVYRTLMAQQEGGSDPVAALAETLR
jgi:flagellar protein FlgJ